MQRFLPWIAAVIAAAVIGVALFEVSSRDDEDELAQATPTPAASPAATLPLTTPPVGAVATPTPEPIAPATPTPSPVVTPVPTPLVPGTTLAQGDQTPRTGGGADRAAALALAVGLAGAAGSVGRLGYSGRRRS